MLGSIRLVISVFSLGQCSLPHAPNSSFLELSNESDEGLVVSPLDDSMSCIHHPTVVGSVTPLHTGMQQMHIVPQQKKRKRIKMQCESKPTQRNVYLYIQYLYNYNIYICILYLYYDARLPSVYYYLFLGFTKKKNIREFAPLQEVAFARSSFREACIDVNCSLRKPDFWEKLRGSLDVFACFFECYCMFFHILDAFGFGCVWYVFFGVFLDVFLGWFLDVFGCFWDVFGMSWVGMATGTLPFVSTCMLVDFPKGTGGAFLEEGLIQAWDYPNGKGWTAVNRAARRRTSLSATRRTLAAGHTL